MLEHLLPLLSTTPVGVMLLAVFTYLVIQD